MGIRYPMGVPRRVVDAINDKTIDELGDLAFDLDIPLRDMPEHDLYDWLRKRIFDWLYEPNWREPIVGACTDAPVDER